MPPSLPVPATAPDRKTSLTVGEPPARNLPRSVERHLPLKIAVSALAAIAIVVKAVYPEWEVDVVTLGLFLVGILPWLAPLIKSVELPGGLKVELQEIKESVQETKGALESVRQRAEFAVITSESSAAAPHPSAPDVRSAKPADTWSADVEALVQEYHRVRAELESGPTRTRRMTEIVTRMVDAAHQNPAWDVPANLRHADRGWRLMAYAFAYARPDFALLEPLVASACDFTDDNQPFGQYWSILAIQRVLGIRGRKPVPVRERTRLEALYRWFVPGTDRREEMRQVMDGLTGAARS